LVSPEEGKTLKLNTAERFLVNNPVRALVQRLYEGPVLRRMGGRLDGARILEAGCGKGTGIKILLDQFGASHVCGIDLDPRQILRAQSRLKKSNSNVFLAVASSDSLPFPDQSFDAVFDFGMLHHVPVWQNAMREICRVLKPSGKIFFEEVTSAALNRWSYRTFFDHPRENRFSEAEFVSELRRNDVDLLSTPRRILRNDIFIGVGQRRGEFL
jgi:ubiquinone/menaquinone biosynthesis C-methylase UbiE